MLTASVDCTSDSLIERTEFLSTTDIMKQLGLSLMLLPLIYQAKQGTLLHQREKISGVQLHRALVKIKSFIDTNLGQFD